MPPSPDVLARAFRQRETRLAVFDVDLRKQTEQWFLDRSVPLAGVLSRLSDHEAFQAEDGVLLVPLHEVDSAELTDEHILVELHGEVATFEDLSRGRTRRVGLGALSHAYPAWRMRFWTDAYEPATPPAFMVEFGDATAASGALGATEADPPPAVETFFESARSALVETQERDRETMRHRFEHLPVAEFVAEFGGIVGVVPGTRSVDEYGQQSVALELPPDHDLAGESAASVRASTGLRAGDEVVVTGPIDDLPVEAELFSIDAAELQLGIYWDSARGAAPERAFEDDADITLTVGKLLDGRRYQTVADAIETVAGTEHARKRFAGTAAATEGELPELAPSITLNQDQRTAVRRALATEHVFAIQAPPWTGARRVVAAIARAAVDQDQRVLLLSTDPATLLDHPVADRRGESIAWAHDLSVRIAPAEGDVDPASDVIAASFDTVGAVPNHGVDLAIVDQAARVDVPSGAIPFAKAARVIAVGDPQQGTPSVPGDGDLPESLFVHLRDRYPAATHALRCQYHMHETIARFPSEAFYDGALVSGGAHRTRTVGPLAPIAGVHIGEDLGRTPTGTVYHDGEIERVLAEVRTLLDHGLMPAEIGIIAATSGQIGKVRGALAEEELGNGDAITVGGLDRFRCRGRAAVIVSFVGDGARLAETYGPAEGLAPAAAVNVVLTRAARRLVLVGDWTAMPDTSPTHRALAEDLRDRGYLDDVG